MNQSEIVQVISVKCGKMCASKSQSVLVLLLIGSESGASLFSQSECRVKQNQSKHNITFDIHLKTVLVKVQKL